MPSDRTPVKTDSELRDQAKRDNFTAVRVLKFTVLGLLDLGLVVLTVLFLYRTVTDIPFRNTVLDTLAPNISVIVSGAFGIVLGRKLPW